MRLPITWRPSTDGQVARGRPRSTARATDLWARRCFSTRTTRRLPASPATLLRHGFGNAHDDAERGTRVPEEESPPDAADRPRRSVPQPRRKWQSHLGRPLRPRAPLRWMATLAECAARRARCRAATG